jgi:predicted permease
MGTAIATALLVVGPVIGLILVGVCLRRIEFLSAAFVDDASKLIYNISLPALLFNSIYQADFGKAANLDMILVSVLGTIALVGLFIFICRVLVSTRTDRGVVVQGAYRSNIGIVGLALSGNAYPAFFATASVFMACTTLIYNLLAVLLLNHYTDKSHSLKDNIFALAKNPIIGSIVIALIFSYFSWTLPSVAQVSLAYFAQLTLPLALICTGASLQFYAMKCDWFALVLANIGKCIIYPGVILTIGYLIGLDGVEMGILFMMCASPTAAASYIMAKKTNSNPVLAANIVVTTTVIAIPIMMLALTALIALGVVAPAQ